MDTNFLTKADSRLSAIGISCSTIAPYFIISHVFNLFPEFKNKKMKNFLSKMFLGTAVLYSSLSTSFAQTDQLTALKDIQDGTEFVEYWGVQKDAAGYTGSLQNVNSGEPKVFYLVHMNNVLNEIGTLSLETKKPSEKSTESNYLRPNHPTQASLFARHYKAPSYLILGGLIYRFKESSKEDVIKGNFKIDNIYEPKSNLDVKEKQNGFMVLLKTQKKSTINKPVCKSKLISDTDHIQVIKNYFKAMELKQTEATKNFTAEQKSKFEKIKVLEKERENKILKTAAEDRAKYIPKGKNDSDDKITLINNTGRSICIVQGGSSKSVGSGTTKFSCSDDIYYGVMNGNNCSSTKGNLIVSKGSCGKTITLK